jgi:1,4-alpha-glucan branching enzyme
VSRLLCPCRSKIKTRLETAYGEWVERIPAWIKWATQDPNEVLRAILGATD